MLSCFFPSPGDAAAFEKILRREDGVFNVRCDYLTGKVAVEHDPSVTTRENLIRAFHGHGLRFSPLERGARARSDAALAAAILVLPAAVLLSFLSAGFASRFGLIPTFLICVPLLALLYVDLAVAWRLRRLSGFVLPATVLSGMIASTALEDPRLAATILAFLLVYTAGTRIERWLRRRVSASDNGPPEDLIGNAYPGGDIAVSIQRGLIPLQLVLGLGAALLWTVFPDTLLRLTTPLRALWIQVSPADPVALGVCAAIALLTAPLATAVALAAPAAYWAAAQRLRNAGTQLSRSANVGVLHQVRLLAFLEEETLLDRHPGTVEVMSVAPATSDELLRLVARAETMRKSALAPSLQRDLAARGAEPAAVEDDVDETPNIVGTARAMRQQGFDLSPLEHGLYRFGKEGRLVRVAARGNTLLGAVAVSVRLKPESVRTAKALQKLGVRGVLLTREETNGAQVLAEQAGLERAVDFSGDAKTALRRLAKSTIGRLALLRTAGSKIFPTCEEYLNVALGPIPEAKGQQADFELPSHDLAGVHALLLRARRAKTNAAVNIFLTAASVLLLILLTTLGVLPPACAVALGLLPAYLALR